MLDGKVLRLDADNSQFSGTLIHFGSDLTNTNGSLFFCTVEISMSSRRENGKPIDMEHT